MGIADKTYYLDKEGNVTEDQEAAATVLINEGQEIPADIAEKYGIGKVAQDEAEAPVEEAKAEKPSANKSVNPTKNKGAKK